MNGRGQGSALVLQGLMKRIGLARRGPEAGLRKVKMAMWRTGKESRRQMGGRATEEERVVPCAVRYGAVTSCPSPERGLLARSKG